MTSVQRTQIRTAMVAIATIALIAAASVRSARADLLNGLWFEAGGSSGSLNPEFSPGFTMPVPAGDINNASGFELTIHQQFSNPFGVYLRGGYARSLATYSQNMEGIFLPAGGEDGFAADSRLNIIPVSAGVDFRIGERALATVFEFGGSMRMVEHVSDPNGVALSSGYKSSFGVTGSVALQWQPMAKLLGGVRVGYASGGDIQFSNFTVQGDGSFAQVYIGFKPWAR